MLKVFESRLSQHTYTTNKSFFSVNNVNDSQNLLYYLEPTRVTLVKQNQAILCIEGEEK